MALTRTMFTLAEDIAETMMEEFVAGNESVEIPDTRLIVKTLELEYPDMATGICKQLLHKSISNCFETLKHEWYAQ